MPAPGNSNGQLLHVLIADASDLTCQSLARAIQAPVSPLQVRTCAGSTAEILGELQANKIEVAVIGVQLKDGPLEGIRVVREMRESAPGIRAILLGDTMHPTLVVEAFHAGAKGLLSRSDSLETLCKCILSVKQGQIWANSEQLQILLEALTRTATPRLVSSTGKDLLTKREGEVARLVAEGLTNRQVSEQLKLSEHTVKNYLFRAYEKLGVSNRVELTLYSVTHRHVASVILLGLLLSGIS